MFDLTETVAPKSDQMNADDLITGPRTFTIAEVRKANGEQPVNVILAEFPTGRPFKPCKSMRRVMVSAWGKDASVYAGKRLTLYRDPKIRFAGDEVGGIRISHMSHIDARLTLALTVTRGKRAPYVVEPLPDDAPTSPAQDETTVARLAELRAEWKDATPDRKKAIEAEVAVLVEGDGVTADEITGGGQPAERTQPPPRDRINADQHGTIDRLFGDLGITGDGQFHRIRKIIGHPVALLGQLTSGEADQIIAALEADLEQPFDEPDAQAAADLDGERGTGP